MANKLVMQDIFAGLAVGNAKAFYEGLAEDVRWTITGTSAWSKLYDGKPAVLELLASLAAQFAGRYRGTPRRFIAEGDHVVVEYRGEVTTTAGQPYHNEYCCIYRLANGKISEITEYCDTELIANTLAPPPFVGSDRAGIF